MQQPMNEVVGKVTRNGRGDYLSDRGRRKQVLINILRHEGRPVSGRQRRRLRKELRRA